MGRISEKWGLCLIVGLLSLTACGTYRVEQPTGEPLAIDNAYADPSYNHTKVVNVLILPVDNPTESYDLDRHAEDVVLAIQRNFGKFNYFNVHFDPYHYDNAGRLIDLDTGRIDRVKLGEIGAQYGVQAVLKVSISEYRPYPPMRIKVKSWLVDTETGQRIWAFDHVFDADDANVVNALRCWWNKRMAGGDEQTRFRVSKIRPSVFSNFVFYTMANSYERSRILNVRAVQQQEWAEKVEEQQIEAIQDRGGYR